MQIEKMHPAYPTTGKDYFGKYNIENKLNNDELNYIEMMVSFMQCLRSNSVPNKVTLLLSVLLFGLYACSAENNEKISRSQLKMSGWSKRAA